MKSFLKPGHSIWKISKRGKVFLNFPGQVSSVGNNVSHTPLFYKEVLDILQPQSDHIFLDMTFGSGGHTNLILDTCKGCRVLASDRDSNSIALAKHMSLKHPHGALTPILSKFSELPSHLTSWGLSKDSVDGVIIDAGTSDLQWADLSRGFCHTKKGPLDLRMDAERFPTHPTASDILQNIDDYNLLKLLKKYGTLKSHSRLVCDAIIEARYMFHRFETVQELREVLRDAISANPITLSQKANLLEDSLEPNWIDALTNKLTSRTITALRLFVNDELNELQYGIRIASHYLKPDGLLLVIVRNLSEERVLKKCLLEMDYDSLLNKTADLSIRTPWKVMGSGRPYSLTDADRALHPRNENAIMYVASKQREMLTLAANQ